MVNQSLMGYNTKNRAAHQELPVKSPVLGKTNRKILLKIDKKQSKKQNIPLKILE